jgi:hypothetical protein
MGSKSKKTPKGMHGINFEVPDLFGDDSLPDGHGVKEDEDGLVVAEIERGAMPRKGSVKKEAEPKKQHGRWKPSRGFCIFTDGLVDAGAEYHRVRRHFPSPEIFDETLVKLMTVLSYKKDFNILCDGSVFPAVAAVAAGDRGKLFLGDKVDPKARDAILKLSPGTKDESEGGKFETILSCYDHVTGDNAAGAILSNFLKLSEGGLMVACFPAEAFLDYSTNIRMEAPNIRNKVHRVCSTHFILRAAGPLMQPSWDILVLSRRGGAGDPPICKWRFTGNGVLPWQKCNEAFSSAPWLLVESLDQAGPAVARCVNYPWEPLPTVY